MNFIRIILSGKYKETGPVVMRLAKPGPKPFFRFDLFYKKVERILASRTIRHVLVERRKDFAAPPFGALEEIRAGLERLSKAGKVIYYYAPEYTGTDCMLSSVCKYRILHPLGQVSFRGMALSSMFFKKFLDKHDVDVTIIRRDRYKNAADRLRTDRFDQYAREQYQALMSGVVDAMRKAVEVPSGRDKKRGVTKETLGNMLDGRTYTADEALEAGMVSELRTLHDLLDEWKKKRYRERFVGKVLRLRPGPRVVVLVFEGMIVDGPNRNHPLFGQVAGDSLMVKQIRALRKNKRVRGVIFRINSPGGSPTASENILRELEALHREKPLVVSMGPVAGSGGYWIAGTGRRMFALPTTLTGSIGVITLFFNLAQLLEKYGITADCVKEGESADLGSALRPMSEKEKKSISHTVDFLYDAFIKRVAKNRKLTQAKVRELGEGRLWLGKDAVKHKLVDQTGGLDEAISHMKKILRTDKVSVRFKPRQPPLMRMLGKRFTTEKHGAWFAEHFTGMQSGIDGGLSDMPFGDTGLHEQGVPLSVARACLSVHGQMFLSDSLLFELFSSLSDPCRTKRCECHQ